MRFGLFASVLLHLAIVFGGLIWLPYFRKLPDVTPEPYIPLDIIREAELDLKTSVPAASKKPEIIEEPEPDLPEPVVEEEPAPVEEKSEPVALPEPEPEPVAPEPEPEPEPEPIKPEPKVEKKPEPPKVKPKEPAPPKKEELDLDALSQLIDKERENENSPSRDAPSQTTQQADRDRSAIGAGDRLTASEQAKMRAAIERCYNTSSLIGAPNPETLLVVLQFELNRDGTLMGQPRVANSLEISFSGNRYWKVAEQASIRAVVSCQPYDFLDPARYDDWKEFEVGMRPME